MNPHHQPRFPLRNIACANHCELARRTSFSLRTIVRWERDGVPYWSADRLATDLGCHPIGFWADGYNAVP